MRRAGRPMPRVRSIRSSANVGVGLWKRELPTQCYRWDPSGKLDMVVTEDQCPDPNGLCFSPDYKKLYVISTGKGPGDTGPGGKGNIYVFDVGSDNKLSGYKLFTDCVVDGIKCGPDGIRADVYGNLWVSSNAGRNVGYNGATCWSPEASCSAGSGSPRSAATSASAAPSATGCSSQAASRSMPCTPPPRERRPVDAGVRLNI